jgi:hypothetical protein
MKIKKYKTHKKNRSNRSNRFRKLNITKKQSGSGILNSIGKFIVNTNPPKNTRYKSSLTSKINLFDLNRYSQNSSKQQNINFQIYYNYNSPKPFHLNFNGNKPLSSSVVELEPHIIIGNMNRYLVVLVDDEPFNRLLWVAEFSNNSKKKTILSYLSPIPKSKKQHNYFIKFYTYPEEIPPFTVMDISGQQRKAEYTNFITYINNPQYKDKIKLVIQFPLNIYKDNNIAISLFNAFTKIGKNTPSEAVQPTPTTPTTPVMLQQPKPTLQSSFVSDERQQLQMGAKLAAKMSKFE